ncbi:MAG: hypothetical protein R3C97_00995 [Geminicoccaceae bacterium]
MSWFAPLLVLLGSALFLGINLDDGIGLHDEYYHLLAARGILETGEPRIAGGEYTRGLLFTHIVAWAIGTFGDTLGAARLPSLVFMALANTVLFVWVHRAAGRVAAWITVILFALSPFAVLTAQYVRFYSLQTLAFTVFAWLLYEAVTLSPPNPRRWLLALLSLPFLALAAYLQPTTFLGLVGVAVWIFGYFALPWLADPDVPAAHKRNAFLALLGAGVAALAIGIVTGLLAEAWQAYRMTPYFNAPERNDFWYYHVWYTLFYPSVWPAIGILSLIAIAGRPKIGGFAVTVFAIAFILNSVAGSKELRYIAYAQAFMFVIVGTALGSAWQRLGGFFGELRQRLEAVLPVPASLAPKLATAALALALLVLVLGNPFAVRTATLLADVTVPGEDPDTQMPLAADILAPAIAAADIVIVAEELQYLYYFDRFDVQFSPTKFAELPEEEKHPFGRDVRTGMPVIEDLASLGLLLDCYRTGLVSAPERRWNNRANLTEEATGLVIERTEVLELPKRSHVRAYRWDHGGGWSPGEACSALEGIGLPPMDGGPASGGQS